MRRRDLLWGATVFGAACADDPPPGPRIVTTPAPTPTETPPDPAADAGLYDVRDYGARPDDPDADLAEAFRAIFDAIDAEAPGGARILVPPGTWTLRTTVVIRHDFLTIAGVNAGFVTGTGNGGGSRIRVEAPVGFHVPVGSAPRPRIEGLTFRDLLLDGVTAQAERTGILVEQDSEGLRVEDVAIKECGEGLVVDGADAATITGCLLAET